MRRLLGITCLLATPAAGLALGIRLFDHDAFATARGDAFVATADNPSAMYYNPAGISQLEGHNVRAAVNLVTVHVDDDPAPAGRSFGTKDETIPVPGLYYVYSPKDFPISFGAAYYIPYGLSLEWPNNTPFRQTTTRGELRYNTITAVASWKILPSLSIAAGPTFNFAQTKLTRAIDIPGASFRFRGDDGDWGAVAGVLWQPTPRHSFGVSYRSETEMNLHGESVGAPILPFQHAETTMTFPQVIIAGYSFRPTTNWNVELDLDWTDWDRVNTLSLNQQLASDKLALNWESSWAVEFGVTRYLSHGLHVSAGYVYIEDSTPAANFTPLVPDQDLHVFSAGVGGQVAHWSWELAYQFTWGPGRSVSGSSYGPAVSGDYTFIANAVSLSLGYRF